MKNSRNPINAQPLPIAGQRLPSNWREVAAQRASLAQADYLWRIQNAWRNNRQAVNIVQQSALSNNEAMPDSLAKHARLTGPVSWDDLLGKQ